MFDLFGIEACRGLMGRLAAIDRLAADAEADRAALAVAREDLKAANRRADDAEKELADARHVIDQCEADRNALAAERDAERDRADRAEDRCFDASWAACKADADRHTYLRLAESYAADADAANAENRELRRLIGNARNQLSMAEGTTPRR